MDTARGFFCPGEKPICIGGAGPFYIPMYGIPPYATERGG